MNPVVSVIMPVRDGGAYLRDAVDSILRQSFADLELILVDDHSADAAIAALERSDPRLQLLANSGQGVSSAFNTGLARARGAFIARMDADDLALPERLARQLAYLDARPDVDICGACVELFSERPLRGGNLRYQRWLNSCRSPGQIHRQMFVESPLPNPTAMFRRQALLDLGGYGDPPWPEDYDLFLRAREAGLRMGKPNEILLRWREHAGRLTRRDARYALERFQAAKAHYLARGPLRDGRPVVLWGAGPTGRLMHDLLAAEGVRIDGFLEVDQRKIGGEKRGRPVWPVSRLEALERAMVLVAVGSPGARERIGVHMESLRRVEGESYLFVA
ncbi:MAG: glycosyltransferase [Xanthomonadales bacterium]|nr:glycosyltransferase [Xanthomonadales bacterium]